MSHASAPQSNDQARRACRGRRSGHSEEEGQVYEANFFSGELALRQGVNDDVVRLLALRVARSTRVP